MNDEKQDVVLQKLLAALRTGGLDALDDGTIDELSDRLRVVQSQRRRASASTLPARALALDALDALTVPSTAQVIASVVEARTGRPFDARAVTTLRRDDRRSWDREAADGMTPAPKVAPALHHELIQPVRALATVSTWELPRRMVTPHSPSADRPTGILALLDEAHRIFEVDRDAAERVNLLACRLAAGIPGAPRSIIGPRGTEAVRRAATEELGRFAELAAEERASAARRAVDVATPEVRIWGRDRGKSSPTEGGSR